MTRLSIRGVTHAAGRGDLNDRNAVDSANGGLGFSFANEGR